MSIEILVEYCREQSKRKWETAQGLHRIKRYADCLFFCHLTLEFELKSCVVEISRSPFPLTHDLVDLAQRTKFPFSKQQQKQLEVINTFNIAGRYDDYKLSFYKKATSTFTKKYFTVTKHLILWLKNTSRQKK